MILILNTARKGFEAEVCHPSKKNTKHTAQTEPTNTAGKGKQSDFAITSLRRSGAVFQHYGKGAAVFFKRLTAVVIILNLLLGGSLPVWAEGSVEAPAISAQSAVLLSADTGEVLYENNAKEKLPMASTTKIMTALIALEEMETIGNPVIEMTFEMVAVEGSSMGLQVGDRLTLEGIVTGMMLASGNDAANTIALYIGGSAEGFAEKMNRRAQEIGMTNTHFVTASGLDDDKHYSTAYDMALLAAEALKNKKFKEICATEKTTVTFESPEKTVWYTNHNKMLGQYSGCIGVKTGYTKKSGRCLVSAAERDGMTVIAVTLNAPDDWNDHTYMLDYSFTLLTKQEFDESAFRMAIPVVGGESQTVSVGSVYGGEITVKKDAAGDIIRVVKLPKFLYAGVKKGDTIGRIEYYSESRLIYSLPVKALNSVDIIEEKRGFWAHLFKRE